jgi:hypothetical protein
MEILSAMVADAASAFDGKLYVHGGGWDTLTVHQFPANHPTLALALVLAADASEAPGTGELRIQLVDEDGNDAGASATGVVAIGHGPMYKPGNRSLLPFAVPFAGIRFEKPGAYEFQVFWDGLAIGAAPAFSVVPMPTPLAGQGPRPPAK